MRRLTHPALLFAGGGAALAAGLYARSCTMGGELLAGAWCGDAPAGWSAGLMESQSAGHCAGCVVAALGAVAMIAGAAMGVARGSRAKAVIR